MTSAAMKYHRKTRELSLQNWWWEDDAPQPADVRPAIKSGLSDFLNYLGAEGLSVVGENFSPKRMAGYFRKIAKEIS